MFKKALLPLAAALLLSAQTLFAQLQYQVTDLLTQCPPGTTGAVARAINSQGDIVGIATLPDANGPTTQFIVWQEGVTSVIPSTGAVVAAGSRGYGITDSGLVAGFSLGNQAWEYFISSQGVATPLADLSFGQFKPCGASDAAVGVTAGQVEYSDANGMHLATTLRAGLWENGAVSELGPDDANAFGSQAVASGISDSGQYICGWGATYWDDLGLQPQAMIMTRDGATTSLGGLGQPWGWATDVNDAGHAVGAAYVDANAYHAFLYRNGSMLRLAPAGWQWSMALAINNSDQVVGYGYDANGVRVPFLWAGGQIYNLNTLLDANGIGYSLTLDAAYDINNAGQIVVSGLGQTIARPFLLTPLAPTAVEGDFNGDGKVSGLDFLVWQRHFPTNSGATRADGDGNDDGKVNGMDFLIWQRNYIPG